MKFKIYVSSGVGGVKILLLDAPKLCVDCVCGFSSQQKKKHTKLFPLISALMHLCCGKELAEIKQEACTKIQN